MTTYDRGFTTGCSARALPIVFGLTLGIFGAGTTACTQQIADGEQEEGASALQITGLTATASSIEAAGREASKAVDGSMTTRWSSQFSDPQWITVDLGAPKAISRVVLNWETAYGKDYQIRVSNDNASWTTIKTVTGGDGGVDDLTGLSANGRYVQMYGTRRATGYGYSIWELQVYAPDTSGTGGSAGTGGSGGSGGTGGSGGSGGKGGSGGSGGTGGSSGSGGSGGSSGTGGSGGSGGTGVWRPQPGTSWQWQLTGTIDTSVNVSMYDIDLFDAPQSTIDKLHSAGRVVICYFSAGSWEDWRPDAGQFPAAALGSNNGWPGEKWLDIRNSTVRSIMLARMDLAVSKHCNGVEPDNVDGFTNKTGFPLTATDQFNYNTFIAAGAHTRKLSVGLKNDVDQVSQLVGYFDWALNEECFRYNECDTLAPFIANKKAVFQVEYGSSSLATKVCPQANALNFDTLIKNLNLDAWRISCR
jgi:hypothetical protein